MTPRQPIVVRGMYGLGDNIYQRAFIAPLARQRRVYLETPWPQLYNDLPGMQFIRPKPGLRTQTKNAAAFPGSFWSRPTPGAGLRATIYVSYGAEIAQRGIFGAMCARFGIEPDPMSLPASLGPAPVTSTRPLAVIRPVTRRSEWQSAAREPRWEYVRDAAARLMETHYVVSVADIDERNEWAVGELPPAHIRYHRGELNVRELLALIRAADVVVGGVGWIVPACIAAGTPLGVILGGRGAHNAPHIISDPRMNTSRVRWFAPDHFCMCSTPTHTCDKRITNFSDDFAAWHNGPSFRQMAA